ncbi:MAG: molybdopterin molybdotransferase MoeA [Pyrinomonadaceae bacterium]|nr:molybdopterin molybdotransferase MoeA [Acidobacteriota bacterium]MBP7474891.1 molybdopterin molybdotransferase MoeA [Pyrinomonadaceae bacterium]MBP9110562.1 molybdopterin molybdotransferase MoeA [Pyrinomonadaceae bacterium]
MIAISKAIKIVERETRSLGAEKILLSDGVGCVLAQDVIADTDLPPFDRSQMDGYAVIADDTVDTPVSLAIIGESAAGVGWNGKVRPGQAVRIMTGARVPEGADSVQRVELTGEANGNVEILEPVKLRTAIVRRGAEIKKGETIFKTGDIVTENMIAALAAFGYAKVKVGKRPRVVILGTGSEIVEIDKRPGRDKIRNSNSVMLDVMCRRFGSEATILPIVRDDISDLKYQILKAAKQNDILIITGGVSVGKYDHTKTALAELGAEIFFDKVRLKPGKPAVFARLGKTLIFGLPGNPVSAAVTFHLFARKAMLQMQGASKPELHTGFATLASDAKAARERDTYLPSRLETNKLGQLVAFPLKWLGSSDFIGFARADSMVFIPKGVHLTKGEVAKIVFL